MNALSVSQLMSYSVIYSFSQNETRYAVELNNFGFFANGTLYVNLASLHLSNESLDYNAHPVSICLRQAVWSVDFYPYVVSRTLCGTKIEELTFSVSL